MNNNIVMADSYLRWYNQEGEFSRNDNLDEEEQAPAGGHETGELGTCCHNKTINHEIQSGSKIGNKQELFQGGK